MTAATDTYHEEYDESEHMIGHGKRLEFADSEDFSDAEAITGTINISTPESELGESEITNDDSEDFHQDYQPGMYEPGECPVTYKYAKTTFEKVETLYQLASVAATRASATKYWRITWGDGSTSVFRGFVKSNTFEGEQSDTVEVEMAIRVRGKVTFTPAASGS